MKHAAARRGRAPPKVESERGGEQASAGSSGTGATAGDGVAGRGAVEAAAPRVTRTRADTIVESAGHAAKLNGREAGRRAAGANDAPAGAQPGKRCALDSMDGWMVEGWPPGRITAHRGGTASDKSLDIASTSRRRLRLVLTTPTASTRPSGRCSTAHGRRPLKQRRRKQQAAVRSEPAARFHVCLALLVHLRVRVQGARKQSRAPDELPTIRAGNRG